MTYLLSEDEARVRAQAVVEERRRIARVVARLPRPGPNATAYERGYWMALDFARQPGWPEP